ncbi:hypothetical protein GW17_00057277 [Ensete ventricosum]|nr:hypothetical protein GW17_00057277 [Ensete ventricosum]
MRLNRVESFYTFLLRFRSEGSPCKGQPGMATASPLAGAVGHLQGGDRLQPRPPLQGGGRLRPGPMQGATTRRPAAHGATARGNRPRPGLPPARAAAGRSDHQQGQRPREVTSPAREVPPEGSSACYRGGCPRRLLRRAATTVAAQIGVRRGLGHPFK